MSDFAARESERRLQAILRLAIFDHRLAAEALALAFVSKPQNLFSVLFEADSVSEGERHE